MMCSNTRLCVILILRYCIVIVIFLQSCKQNHKDSIVINSPVTYSLDTDNTEVKEFDPNNIYDTCLDVHGLFNYLIKDTLFIGVWYNHTQIPDNWICEESLPILTQMVKSNQDCSGLQSTLQSVSPNHKSKSNVHDVAIFLLRYYLKDWESSDEVIIERATSTTRP